MLVCCGCGWLDPLPLDPPSLDHPSAGAHHQPAFLTTTSVPYQPGPCTMPGRGIHVVVEGHRKIGTRDARNTTSLTSLVGIANATRAASAQVCNLHERAHRSVPTFATHEHSALTPDFTHALRQTQPLQNSTGGASVQNLRRTSPNATGHAPCLASHNKPNTTISLMQCSEAELTVDHSPCSLRSAGNVLNAHLQRGPLRLPHEPVSVQTGKKAAGSSADPGWLIFSPPLLSKDAGPPRICVWPFEETQRKRNVPLQE